MIFDQENNEVKLVNRPNGHRLLIGKSGMGKTYCCCRIVEDELNEGKNILIVDFSGSYRASEMKKNQFMNTNRIRTFNPALKPYYFFMRADSIECFQKEVFSAFADVLKITGYRQKATFSRLINTCVECYKEVSPLTLYITAEKMLADSSAEENESEFRCNMDKLLERLEVCSDIKNVHIRLNVENKKERGNSLTILQLSDFPEEQRTFLAELYTALLWKEAFLNPRKIRYDAILLEEFQHLSLSEEGAFSRMLREGRKFGISLILTSQFIGNYDKQKQETLEQVGNLFIFKPVARDMSSCLKLIDSEDIKFWKDNLRKLQIGQCILCGHYTLNENPLIQGKALICTIQ